MLNVKCKKLNVRSTRFSVFRINRLKPELRTKNYELRTHRRRGMALLTVLFIVAAVMTVSLGILYRADLAAAGGHNYALRTKADYIAWAGLEHARALIVADPDNPATDASFALDDEAQFFYILPSVAEPNKADPALWRYEVACEVYYIQSSTTQPYSKVTASVLYDPNELNTPRTRLARIRRDL